MRPTNNLPQQLIDSARAIRSEKFDAQRHVNYKHPSKIYTVKDIGLEGQGISPKARYDTVFPVHRGRYQANASRDLQRASPRQLPIHVNFCQE